MPWAARGRAVPARGNCPAWMLLGRYAKHCPCHRSPNRVRKIPLSALGDFTTTIFKCMPSLFIRWNRCMIPGRSLDPEPGCQPVVSLIAQHSAQTQCEQAPREKHCRDSPCTAGGQRQIAPGQPGRHHHRLPSLGFHPSIRPARIGCDIRPNIPQRGPEEFPRASQSIYSLTLWLRISRARPVSRVTATVRATGSLLTEKVLPRVSAARLRGYFTPRRVTPVTCRSRGTSER